LALGFSQFQFSEDDTMFKAIINEAKASIESKMTGFFLILFAGLTLTAILSYGLIKLIWYFEAYLVLNYGLIYAVSFVGVVVVLSAVPFLFIKYGPSGELDHEVVSNNDQSAPSQPVEIIEEVMALPDKILYQAFTGFMQGLRTSKPNVEHPSIENTSV
jgi:hypothetical protein